MRKAMFVVAAALTATSALLPVGAADAQSAVSARTRSTADVPDGWACYRQGEIVYFDGRPYRALQSFCGVGFDPATVPALWAPAW
ncbi:hypothetical protein [Streptosporangium carneum]|uniref:Chitin-binding type-3 domain-containing protein n=1 Tax=Streptosporangium carneum TaxID=47481 RepID=A0A9W6MBP4_9ACTN|nr:hypothetical protein [Streptosporangium carneum]GLK07888.1 hypothetical protein GCM10017600_12930 [Streptosporangium carneum]